MQTPPTTCKTQGAAYPPPAPYNIMGREELHPLASPPPQPYTTLWGSATCSPPHPAPYNPVGCCGGNCTPPSPPITHRAHGVPPPPITSLWDSAPHPAPRTFDGPGAAGPPPDPRTPQRLSSRSTPRPAPPRAVPCGAPRAAGGSGRGSAGKVLRHERDVRRPLGPPRAAR